MKTLVAPGNIEKSLEWFSFRARVFAKRLAGAWAGPARAHRSRHRSHARGAQAIPNCDLRLLKP